jgi:hypothetical protein
VAHEDQRHQELEALDKKDGVGVLEVEALNEAADPVEAQELEQPTGTVSNKTRLMTRDCCRCCCCCCCRSLRSRQVR